LVSAFERNPHTLNKAAMVEMTPYFSQEFVHARLADKHDLWQRLVSRFGSEEFKNLLKQTTDSQYLLMQLKTKAWPAPFNARQKNLILDRIGELRGRWSQSYHTVRLYLG
jgi:hypothetical protein